MCFIKKLCWVFGLIALPTILPAQIYHIYRPVSQIFDEKTDASLYDPSWQLYAVGVGSWGSVTDRADNQLSRALYGGQISIFVKVWNTLSVGIEGEMLQGKLNTPFLRTFHRNTVAGLVKWNMTPHTEPQVYLMWGVGAVWQKTQFLLRDNDMHASNIVFVLGMGGEIKIWKELRFIGQYRLTYEPHSWENFALSCPELREELLVGGSYRF